MCGILGCFSDKVINENLFCQSLNLIKHRGPDFSHYTINNGELKNFALGHTRLSIVDLSSESNQPFCDNNQILVFNGEIYNYKLLKEKLLKLNVSFKTNGDTEVILKLYQTFGIEKTLNMIEGMFAFCIYDRDINRVFLARDKFGVKPLVYSVTHNELFFSSEIKSILKYYEPNKFKVNKNSEASFFFHRYVLEPNTIFNDIKMLESGHFIEYDIINHKISNNPFWSPVIGEIDLNEEKIIDKLDYLLFESVKNQLASDVPIGLAFSGGLDSSIILAMAKKINPDINAFTVKRSENDIDTKYAVLIADHLKVKLDIINYENNLSINEINYLHHIYDQPIGCSSIFSTFILFKEISRKGIKVVLIGDGADELFGGYNWHQDFLKSRLTIKNIINFPKKILKYNCLISYDDEIDRYKKIMLNRFSENEILNDLNIDFNYSNLYQDTFFKYGGKNFNNIKDLMLLDFSTFMKYNLVRADFSSMAHSIEARVPFLNTSIVDLAFNLPNCLINKNNEPKYLLKKLAERYLPKELIYRPKKGFSSPVTEILPVKNGKEYQKYIMKEWRKIYDK